MSEPELLGGCIFNAMIPVPTLWLSTSAAEALVRRFEVFAGRAAMGGFAALVSLELVTSVPVVGMTQAEGSVFISAVLCAVAAASAAAVLRPRQPKPRGGLLLEAVIASLTSIRGAASSASSVPTPLSLDHSVNMVSVVGIRHAGQSRDAGSQG